MFSVVLNLLQLNFLLNTTTTSSDSSKLSVIDSKKIHNHTTEVCYSLYDEVVCFDLGKSWPNDSIPVVKVPSNPDDISTTFYLFSRGSSTTPTMLNPGNIFSIMNSSIKKAKSVKIITHGYSSSSQAMWFKEMVGEFLRADEENIIAVDWSKGASSPYAQTVANIRVVGVQLAVLIYIMIRYGDVSPSAIHIIGHSLGAHLAGYCGSYLNHSYGITIPRITGLDPAGPFFIDAPPTLRLDPSDADFVDVIHTDNSHLLGFPLSVGIVSQVGHLDFYPNGGDIQPECKDFPSDIRCRHHRASKLFVESIRQSCTFTAVRCLSYEKFVQGECWGCESNSCSVMGLKAKPLENTSNNDKFFLMTNGYSPFCGSHYRITVISSTESTSWQHGGEFAVIGVNLVGARDSTGEILLSEKSIFFKSGTIHRRVFLATDVGNLLSVKFYFHYHGSFLNPMSWRIRSPTLYISSIIIEQLKPEKRWKFCFKPAVLDANKEYELNRRNLC